MSKEKLVKAIDGVIEELKKAASHEEGVHKPSQITGDSKGGTSSVGLRVKALSSVPSSNVKAVMRSQAKEIHKEIFDKLKSMPKPNLPKSEISSGPALEKAKLDKNDPKTHLPGTLLDKAQAHPLIDKIKKCMKVDKAEDGSEKKSWLKKAADPTKPKSLGSPLNPGAIERVNAAVGSNYTSKMIKDKAAAPAAQPKPPLAKGKIDDLRQEMARDQGVMPEKSGKVPKVKQDRITGVKDALPPYKHKIIPDYKKK